jgi:hypothetical protein
MGYGRFKQNFSRASRLAKLPLAFALSVHRDIDLLEQDINDFCL